ncbi:hypothetical protein NDK43_31900 [Neobacillus pocheonensis]|uniref:Cytochrome c domain-containing protein n=1 Tax=Neobacillus pocheonensis TaxID=363869 RepID=A0ABT0WJ76_9BACI|nr:hypothetical protein [Neobacillus pocheonensis]
MNLREQLGNVKLSDADKFKTTSTSWTSSDERTFCLKCHNNTTEIYGKTGTFNTKDATGTLISAIRQGIHKLAPTAMAVHLEQQLKRHMHQKFKKALVQAQAQA